MEIGGFEVNIRMAAEAQFIYEQVIDVLDRVFIIKSDVTSLVPHEVIGKVLVIL